MSEPITYQFEVNVLLLQENETWIAQGLEFDITGHGPDIEAAIENFGKTFLGQVIVDLCHKETPLGNVKKAPRPYWEWFNKAQFGWRRDGEEKRFEMSPEETLPAYMISALAADMRIRTS